MRAVCAAVLLSGAVAAAQECTDDAACGPGSWCLLGAGCEGPRLGACVPETFASEGEFCGCDGGTFSWARAKGSSLPRWKELGACDLDAGPPRTWRDEPWADAFDELGMRRAPTLKVLDVQPAPAPGCAGATAKLAPPAGQRFAPRSTTHRVLFGCEELPATTWSPTGITVKLPLDAGSGCLALVDGDAHTFAAYRAACLLSTTGPRVQFAGDAGFDNLAACRGDATNRLEISRLPALAVSAFGEHGLATWDSATSLLSDGQGPTSLEWDAGVDDTVTLNGARQSRQGALTLPLSQPITLTATNRCGTTTRTLRGSTMRLPWAAQELDLAEQPGGVTVYLPDVSANDRTLKVKVDGPMSAPAKVTVPAGSNSVVVPIAPPPRSTAQRSTVRITAPGAPALPVSVSATHPRGFADLHVHQFANEAFGGVGVYGDPRKTPEEGINDCRISHGKNGGADFLQWQMQGSAGLTQWGKYDTTGWRAFPRWPDATDYTHQQVHAVQLKEAWRGGLRLMVMLAVENGSGCGVARTYAVSGTKFGCDPTQSVERQLQAANDFAAENSDWYQIVSTPAEARDAFAHDRLAVVLGVEVDWLLDCKNWGSDRCQNAQADEIIAFLQRHKVTHVFPTHFVTNAFGGAALMNPLTSSSSGRKEACSKPGYKFAIGGIGPSCNPDAFTSVGRYFVRRLMEKNFIVDIDHQSLYTRDEVERIARDEHYPLVSGHSTFFEVSRAAMLSENTLRPDTVKHVYDSGGMVALITNQANQLKEVTQVPGAPPHTCGRSVDDFAQAYRHALKQKLNIGFGSDFNGFNGQPGGRQRVKCLGGGAGAKENDPTLVTYPFFDDVGERFEEPQIGAHRYNVNTDGLAHIGMYPHFIEALRKLGFTRDELMPLMTSADAYVRIWEAIISRGSLATSGAQPSSTGAR